MLNLLALTLEILIIFLTSQYIFKSFFLLLLLMFRNKSISVSVLSFFFLPGVIVHELSHLLTAEVLRVKTHGIEFFPELHGGSLKMGSVLVEDSDLFRQFLIGIAPFISGLSILFALFFFISPYISLEHIFSSVSSFLLSVVFLYAVFIITNTMFSSKKDMDGAVELIFITIVIFVMCFILKLHVENYIIIFFEREEIKKMLEKIIFFLCIPLSLNILSAILASVMLKRKGIQISE